MGIKNKGMKNCIILCVLFLLPLQLAFGQRKGDYQQMYLRAKNLYQQERWTDAMEAFRELSAGQRNNSFAEYASFYYALSAIKADRLNEAKSMLRQIRSKHAGWDKQEEVSYWLANVYMREGNYRQAIETIQDIRNERVQADAEEMAVNYLHREEDVDRLRKLLSEYPDTPYLARVLAGKISRQPLPEQDRDYLQQLVDRYQLKEEDFLNQSRLGESERKSVYHVAVMLPFLHNELQPEPNLHDRYFVLDMYEGMKIAREELEEQGIELRLHAYDTKRDSLTTRRLLNSQEMLKMDLIVGPLYPGPNRIASEFAIHQGINMVNPLSTNPEVIRNNPYSFLFKPSLATQGRKAADFAAKNFEEKTAMVIFGPKERDSIMAYSYKQEIEKAGFTVRQMAKIPAGEESMIRTLLVPESEDQMKEGGRLHRKSIGHVFVASEDELIVANALTALMGRGDRLPMIGHESWLRKNFVSYDQLERLGVYFVAPEFIDYSSEGFTSFRQKYIDKVNNMPSRYAYIGYDLLMYFGKMMNEHGTLFQKEMQREPFRKGVLSTGFSYLGSNDNQSVPVVKFRDSALEIVYQ